MALEMPPHEIEGSLDRLPSILQQSKKSFELFNQIISIQEAYNHWRINLETARSACPPSSNDLYPMTSPSKRFAIKRFHCNDDAESSKRLKTERSGFWSRQPYFNANVDTGSFLGFRSLRYRPAIPRELKLLRDHLTLIRSHQQVEHLLGLLKPHCHHETLLHVPHPSTEQSKLHLLQQHLDRLRKQSEADNDRHDLLQENQKLQKQYENVKTQQKIFRDTRPQNAKSGIG